MPVIFLTSGTSFTVPADWTSVNKIHLIARGQPGTGASKSNNGAGGTGANYAALVNKAYTPGATISFSLGGVYTALSWFDGTSSSDALLMAGVGGGNLRGDVTHQGGSGAPGGSAGPTASAGGAAGGPHGAGDPANTSVAGVSNNGFTNEWAQTSDGALATPGGGGTTGVAGHDYGGGGAGGTTTGTSASAGGAPIIVVEYESLPLSKDSFTDSNSTQLTSHTPNVGPTWSVMTSPAEWTIESNQLTRTNSTIDHAYVDVAVADMTATATFSQLTNLSSVLIRRVDGANYWELFYNYGVGWQLDKVTGGVDHWIGANLPGDVGTVTLMAQGNVITAIGPRGDRVTTTDAALNTATQAGLILTGFGGTPSLVDDWLVNDVVPSWTAWVTLSGAGSATIRAVQAKSAVASLLGSSSLSTLSRMVWGTAPSLSGEGVLSPGEVLKLAGYALLVGDGELVETDKLRAVTRVTFAGAGQLFIFSKDQIAAGLLGAGRVAVNAGRALAAGASLSGSGAVGAVGSRRTPARIKLTGRGAVLADSIKVLSVSTRGFGTAMLYRNAAPLEQAMADVDSDQLMAINAESIIENWDPTLVQTKNIPYLAYAMGVTLWEDDYWLEGTKRQWIAEQWTFKSLRGTLSGIRMALDINDYELVESVTPPQGTYATPDISASDWNTWIRRMPELRFTFSPITGKVSIYEEICDEGFADDAFVPIDDGFALRGRFAFLRRDGVVTPLSIITYLPGVEYKTSVDYERVAVPGHSAAGLFADDGAADDDQYVGQESPEAYVITVTTDSSFIVDATKVELTTIKPGMTPISPFFEVNSDHGDGNGFSFEGDWSDDGFADATDGGDRLLAQRMYLLDKSVSVPMTDGISFADVSVVGLPTYCEKIMIDLHTKEPLDAYFSDETAAEEGFVIDDDLSHVDRACRSVVAAKALRDTALLSFSPKRLVTMGDIIDETTTAATWVTDIL